MQEWCHGCDSFAQKVQHSPVLAQWWSDECDFWKSDILSCGQASFFFILEPSVSHLQEYTRCVQGL